MAQSAVDSQVTERDRCLESKVGFESSGRNCNDYEHRPMKQAFQAIFIWVTVAVCIQSRDNYGMGISIGLLTKMYYAQ